jgi:hypothetical protein
MWYFKCYQTLLFEKYAIRISSVYARKTSSRIIAKLLLKKLYCSTVEPVWSDTRVFRHPVTSDKNLGPKIFL